MQKNYLKRKSFILVEIELAGPILLNLPDRTVGFFIHCVMMALGTSTAELLQRLINRCGISAFFVVEVPRTAMITTVFVTKIGGSSKF